MELFGRYVYVPHVPIEIVVVAIAIILVALVSQQMPSETFVSREETPPSFVMELGAQYPVSEILEYQEKGIHIHMPPFVRSSDSDDYHFTALVADIHFSQRLESETTIFTAVAVSPVTVVVTLYDERNKTCGKVMSRPSPPFPRETAKTFFGIDSDKATLLVAKVPLKGAKTISVDYVYEPKKPCHIG